MAVTIADLDWQDDSQLLYSIVVSNYSWLMSVTVVEGYKGKARIADYDISLPLLKAFDCDVPSTNDIALNGKDVTINPYDFRIPVCSGDIEGTWLNGYAMDATEYYLDNLAAYLSEIIGTEIKSTVFAAILTEGAADAVVEKVTVTAGDGTAAGALATLHSFVDGLSDEFLDKAYDEGYWNEYIIHISPRTYSLLTQNADLHSYPVVSGFSVIANSALSGDEMICTPDRNILVAFDDTVDANTFRVVSKQELSQEIIVGQLAFGGSYRDSERIAITA